MTETITPSSLWQGSPSAGSRWSVEQLSVLDLEGVADPESVATATVMRTPRHNAQNWAMPPQPVPTVMPRLALRRDGKRAKVVTPAGAVIWAEIAHG